jgi:hypothetical protein
LPVTELAAQKKYLAVRYLLAPNLQRKKALMACMPMKNRPAMQQVQLALTPSAGEDL